MRLQSIFLLTIFFMAGLARADDPVRAPLPWHGFKRFEQNISGRPATVIVPKTAAPGRPWIWRATFFDYRPELDATLATNGFHVVFLNTSDLLGSPTALKEWDACYAEMTGRWKLSKRPVLEAVSRGGLVTYRWAASHPDQVSCIYGLVPVCDFKSWPGAKGAGKGDASQWAAIQRLYGFQNETEALAFQGNPVDILPPIAQARIPILHVCAEDDDVVPYSENTAILKQHYEKLGGKIEVLTGKGGHFYGLTNLEPALKFILNHTAAAPGALDPRPR